MKDRILTKVVGTQHYDGAVEVGETVKVVKDATKEYPQVLAVLNAAGEKIGNIVSKVDDFDLVRNHIVNNFALYDDVESYDFTVKRVAKYYVMLVGTLKETDDVMSVEELESLVKNYKESIHLMFRALDELDPNDVLTSGHIKSQLDSTIELHNKMSNRLIEIQNAVAKEKPVVFDYYSKEAAK